MTPAGIYVLHASTLHGLPDGLDPAHHDAIASHIRCKFRCVPILIPPDLHTRFYHGFCKHYLWPLLHYLLPLSPSSLGGLRFYLSLWCSYLSANKLFIDRLTEVLNPNDDFICIQDYHLLVLPTFLCKCFHRVKLEFFLHSPFPSSEIFCTVIVIAGSLLHRSLSLLSIGGAVLLTASPPQFTSFSRTIYSSRFILDLFSCPAPLAIATCRDATPRRWFPSPLPLSSHKTKEGKPPWVDTGKKKRKKK